MTLPKIDPEKLREYVRKYPDDTQEEIAVAFGKPNLSLISA